MTSSARQTGGGNFKIEALMAYRAEEKMCLPVLRSNNLLTCHSGPFLISSHRIVSMCNSWKLLIASHCHHGLCHLISSHLVSCLLSVFHSSHIIISSPSHLSFSQPFSADHNCFHLFSCHLSFSHLFSSELFSFSSSKIL